MFESMSQTRRIRIQLEARTTRELLDKQAQFQKMQDLGLGSPLNEDILQMIGEILSERKEE